jgi:hypothetical protein
VALADRFASYKPAPKGPACSIGSLLAGMDADDKVALQQALDDTSIQSRTIWRVLIDEGYEISDAPIARHRRGLCLCSRKDSQS